MIESRKNEIRYVTNDPKKMLGKWTARRVTTSWLEDFVDADTQQVVSVERSEIIFERGTYINQDVLCQIKFAMQEGSIKEIEVSNQNRQGIQFENNDFYPYKAVVRIDGTRKTFLLYATSVANALLILVDYVELNFQGGFTVCDIKEMDFCVVLIDRLQSKDSRRYELDTAYLNGEISMEDYVETTCDNISKGNPDAEENDSKKDNGKKFYQIVANIIMHDDKEGDIEQNHSFIVQTVSAVRANMLIEKYLRDKQDKRYRESLKHPERTFVRYQINSFIEESKIIPIGIFIPKAFSEVYNENTNDNE